MTAASTSPEFGEPCGIDWPICPRCWLPLLETHSADGTRAVCTSCGASSLASRRVPCPEPAEHGVEVLHADGIERAFMCQAHARHALRVVVHARPYTEPQQGESRLDAALRDLVPHWRSP